MDDDYTHFTQFSLLDTAQNGDYFILPTTTPKIVFRNLPTRARDITLIYQSRHVIPADKTTTLTVPNNHRTLLLAFSEAYITSHDSKEVAGGDIPTEETYFLGQLS